MTIQTLLNNLYTKLVVKCKPARLWNCDETSLTCVKSGKTVRQVGRKYVYKQSFDEKGVNKTGL
jgi:hypothetical protein